MKKLVLTFSLLAVAPFYAEEATKSAATETVATEPAKNADVKKGNDNNEQSKGLIATVGDKYNNIADSVDNFCAKCPGSSYVSSLVEFARTNVKMTVAVVAVATAALVRACDASSSEAEL